MTWAGERGEPFCSFQSPGLFFPLTLPFIERANHYHDGLGVDSIDREQGPLPDDLADQCRHAGTEEKHGGSKEAFA